MVKVPLKGEVGGRALNSNGYTSLIMEYLGKIMELFFFVNFCGNSSERPEFIPLQKLCHLQS